MLRMDAGQQPRLLQIENDTYRLLKEARNRAGKVRQGDWKIRWYTSKIRERKSTGSQNQSHNYEQPESVFSN